MTMVLDCRELSGWQNDILQTFVACINSYVERLLDRISNGKLAEDRRTAMAELQSVVGESRASQLAFGAMGECFSLVYLFVLIMIVMYV